MRIALVLFAAFLDACATQPEQVGPGVEAPLAKPRMRVSASAQ